MFKRKGEKRKVVKNVKECEKSGSSRHERQLCEERECSSRGKKRNIRGKM